MSEATALVQVSWKHGKKDGLGALLRRALDAAGADPGPPTVALVALDPLVGGAVSAVARAVKKHPHLKALVGQTTLPGAQGAVPSLSTEAPGGRIPIPIADLLALADGVPRSLPFYQVMVGLSWPEPHGFSLRLHDQWWVSGRMRASVLTYAAQVEPGARRLPPAPEPVARLMAAFGKPVSSLAVPIPGAPPPQATGPAQAEGGPRAPVQTGGAAAVAEVVRRHRETLLARIAEAGLPNDLGAPGMGEAAGPMKPLLVETFRPRGFDCKGGRGTFTLRRRTPDNHVVELSLDVGTWSHLFSGFLAVLGPGFRAAVPLPVCGEVRQVPIRGAEGCRRIVENLAVVVDVLERGFVREVEQAAGPAPDWFEA